MPNRYSNCILPRMRTSCILSSEPIGGTKFFVLIDPKYGLGHPYNVAQKDIFFFHEFSDETTSTKGRRTSWNELVRAQSVQVTDDTILTEKQPKFKRARDTSKIICAPEKSFATDEKCLFLAVKIFLVAERVGIYQFIPAGGLSAVLAIVSWLPRSIHLPR
jgi:hypothetical protein